MPSLLRQTATPGFMALHLPPKEGILQGINDWELSQKAIQWIYIYIGYLWIIAQKQVGNSYLLFPITQGTGKSVLL